MRIDSAEDYFQAGLQRMSQAWNLYNEVEGGSYALAMYVSGVAVECLLRAFKRRRDTTFDEKHDLRRLFKASGMLEFLPETLVIRGMSEEQADIAFRQLHADLNDVYELWSNDYRYASETRLRSHLKSREPTRGIKGDILKARTLALLTASQRFMDKGVLQWKVLSKRSKKS
jgi:hypothetical protein